MHWLLVSIKKWVAEEDEQAANIPAVLIGRHTDKICHIDKFFPQHLEYIN